MAQTSMPAPKRNECKNKVGACPYAPSPSFMLLEFHIIKKGLDLRAPMFSKILIANRGEIACRIIRTARRMGIHTVAVYSDADARGKHIRMADESVHIGGAAARDSYLKSEA